MCVCVCGEVFLSSRFQAFPESPPTPGAAGKSQVAFLLLPGHQEYSGANLSFDKKLKKIIKSVVEGHTAQMFLKKLKFFKTCSGYSHFK